MGSLTTPMEFLRPTSHFTDLHHKAHSAKRRMTDWLFRTRSGPQHEVRQEDSAELAEQAGLWRRARMGDPYAVDYYN